MARRRTLGESSRSLSWLKSAIANFERTQKRATAGTACHSIGHYTDVIAEASVAAVLAENEGAKAIATRAERVIKQGATAQNDAIQTCRRSH